LKDKKNLGNVETNLKWEMCSGNLRSYRKIRERYRGPRDYRKIQGDNRRLHDLISSFNKITNFVINIEVSGNKWRSGKRIGKSDMSFKNYRKI
jgi:hypothetical protein